MTLALGRLAHCNQFALERKLLKTNVYQDSSTMFVSILFLLTRVREYPSMRLKVRMPERPMSARYATRADFCRAFAQDTSSLYLLSLLLTASPDSAEECFVSSLADVPPKSAVFKKWLRSYTRRIVVQRAVQMLRRIPSAANKSYIHANNRFLSPAPELNAVLKLGDFERFVFVLSILEGYSDRECSLFLGCSKREVLAGKIAAMQALAAGAHARDSFIAESPQLQNGSALQE
jgi:DNA-directed RNA polymerase specialized sigma24 family protein